MDGSPRARQHLHRRKCGADRCNHVGGRDVRPHTSTSGRRTGPSPTTAARERERSASGPAGRRIAAFGPPARSAADPPPHSGGEPGQTRDPPAAARAGARLRSREMPRPEMPPRCRQREKARRFPAGPSRIQPFRSKDQNLRLTCRTPTQALWLPSAMPGFAAV